MEAVITASEAQRILDNRPEFANKIKKFNELVKSECDNGSFNLHLYFEEWGYNYEDVEFIKSAGYVIDRCSACLWWEVRLPDKW